MADDTTDNIVETSEDNLVQDGQYAIYIDEVNGIIHGSVTVDNNFKVERQLSTKEFKVFDDTQAPVLYASANGIKCDIPCKFTETVKFNDGKTVIGTESTYGSAYVGSQTIQAGARLIVGDSCFRISSVPREILADTFRMVLNKLEVDEIEVETENADLIITKKLRATEDFIANQLYASVIKTDKLYIDEVSALNVNVHTRLKAKDLTVEGTGVIGKSLVVAGLNTNGAALTVNGSHILANYGIVSHTWNNIFQSMRITGGSGKHDVCFKVDRDVDSLFEGDVTIQGSKLVLDNSKLISDNVTVTPLEALDLNNPLTGIQLTTDQHWEMYKEGMIEESDADEAPSLDGLYDPVAEVRGAVGRVTSNYQRAQATVKSLINPIQYAMEQGNPNTPKRFTVKQGVYRIDNTGRALLKNVVAENGRFSKLEAYQFNINRLNVDKLITTAVASNVVDTDNLLKSRGIAEFDGAVNINGDVFVENGSVLDVAEGAKVKFHGGSELKLDAGSKFEMGEGTTIKMSGDMELDLAKLVFVDSATGRKYKIGFKDDPECADGVIMTYKRLEQEDTTNEDVVEETGRSAREIVDKLKSLGL